MHRTLSSRSRGFTLLEVMVVMGILALISLMGIYSLRGARIRVHAQDCRGTLQMLHTAVSTFGIERHLARGAGVHMTNLYPRFFGKPTPGTCPASGVAYALQFTYGTAPVCPSAALYTNHVWSPSQSLGL
ncbi:MAG: prepilin-type N-terminal cleavage/methylation domain-containing protein [bacterium]|nr:prepilin-type N-terminal cleavage/methylation domain-containing protein [bacterium]